MSERNSLYELIRDAVQENGRLPEWFSLPEGEKESGAASFSDGARDGIALYHMGPRKENIEGLIETLKLVNDDKPGEAYLKLKEFFSDDNNRMLFMVDPLANYLFENHADFSPEKVYAFATALMRSSDNAECIKFGLALFEMINVDDGTSYDVVRTLALCNEFTMFCAFSMRQWPDANNELLAAARKVDGWGRVHTVRYLAPLTEEARVWMLREGCRNTIMPAYSALEIAMKCDPLRYLQRPTCTKEEYEDIRFLFLALLDESAVPGLSLLPDKEDLLKSLLELALNMDGGAKDLVLAAQIEAFIKDKDMPEVQQLVNELRQARAA